MKVKCIASKINSFHLKKGTVYEAWEDNQGYYVLCEEGDKLYFDLATNKCSWFRAFLDREYYTFEEVKEEDITPRKDAYNYATSPKVMVEVLLKMADNISKGLRPKEGIQIKTVKGFVDIDNHTITLEANLEYRVKPETITLKNGIEVPKPLNDGDIIDPQQCYFTPCCNDKMCYSITGYIALRFNYKLIYKTKEEAIEASKALFGLEIKDV